MTQLLVITNPYGEALRYCKIPRDVKPSKDYILRDSFGYIICCVNFDEQFDVDQIIRQLKDKGAKKLKRIY